MVDTKTEKGINDGTKLMLTTKKLNHGIDMGN